nr:hypothetical protein Iba_chr07cCG8170 [Ipomoea batatas]
MESVGGSRIYERTSKAKEEFKAPLLRYASLSPKGRREGDGCLTEQSKNRVPIDAKPEQ